MGVLALELMLPSIQPTKVINLCSGGLGAAQHSHFHSRPLGKAELVVKRESLANPPPPSPKRGAGRPPQQTRERSRSPHPPPPPPDIRTPWEAELQRETLASEESAQAVNEARHRRSLIPPSNFTVLGMFFFLVFLPVLFMFAGCLQ